VQSQSTDSKVNHVTVQKHRDIKTGPSFQDFQKSMVGKTTSNEAAVGENDSYLDESLYSGFGRTVYYETYGCQMNVNDTEIARSILEEQGFSKTDSVEKSDVVLVMTCSIREGAEQKIWNRLQVLAAMKRRRSKKKPLQIGLLGCMAERLKEKILDKQKLVDVICGPDAYRDLPRLLYKADSYHSAVNVQLSLEETYADIMPIRINPNSTSAFVSIMRGCDNMCTYCIVPFTRGRERSRPVTSILNEVKELSNQGIKEVTLLGQNVNSYRDISEKTHNMPVTRAEGFNTVYKPKKGGHCFAHLLEKVSEVDPEMRVRFTSPHPKDFPDEVLYLIRDRANICNQLHVPAQSGSSAVLDYMRRGYTRETYLQLIDNVRHILPDVSLSSDFIAGFCGETEEDHMQTVSLMKQVRYNRCYTFPYSMREKTRAHHRLTDDVLPEVKRRRHEEISETWRAEAALVNSQLIGTQQLVLVEGDSSRSSADLAGRNDGNTRVVLPQSSTLTSDIDDVTRPAQCGDYVVVDITSSSSHSLRGTALYRTNMSQFASKSDADESQISAEL